MNAYELLQDIKTNVDELIEYAEAGGDKQNCFDLHSDKEDMQKVEEIMSDFMRRVSTEHNKSEAA